MQPLLNASKAKQTIPAGSLQKQDPSENYPKNIMLGDKVKSQKLVI